MQTRAAADGPGGAPRQITASRVAPHGWSCDAGPDGSVLIRHGLSEHTVSDDRVVTALAGFAATGALTGQDEFEMAAVAVITSAGPDERSSWRAFYRNSVAELSAGSASFSPVHLRARSLLRGTSVLEVGCCFGLLALQCALDGYEVTACDICPGALELLDSAAADFALPLTTVHGDARALPFASGSVDTVTLIHLLEHLDGPDVATALGEALRVARHRVVVAVPFEEHPNAHFGHRQRLTEHDLRVWSRDWPLCAVEIFTDHGGWLVLDHR